MATAGVAPAALELLQQYGMDVKDFGKARARYTQVLEEEPPAAVEGLSAAWTQYVASIQNYLQRLTQGVLGPRSHPAPTDPLTCSAVLFRPRGTSSQFNLAGSFDLGATGPATGPPLRGLRRLPNESEEGLARAERLSDLCTALEKWYLRHEAYLLLPEPETLARRAAAGMASLSRLFRLLWMRLACVCATHTTFMRTLLLDTDGPAWAALFVDRQLFPEVEALLTWMERLLAVPAAADDPPLPLGWFYRVAALLDPLDHLPNVPPKRRSQAIRVALGLLQRAPEPATAVGLHTTLLRVTLEKGGATAEETQAIVRGFLALLDDPLTRPCTWGKDMGVLFAPFFDLSATSTPEYLATLNNAREVLVLLLASWVGNFWIAAEATCLRTLIDLLHLPGDVDKKMVIFTVFNHLLLRLAPHRGIRCMETWNGMEEDRRRRAAAAAAAVAAVPSPPTAGYDGSTSSTSQLHESALLEMEDGEGREDVPPPTRSLGYHVLDPLLGRALLVLAYHGLPLALIGMMQTMGRNRVVMEGASHLLQDLFVLMDTVLPKSMTKELHENFNWAVGRLANQGDLFMGGLTSQLFHDYKTNHGSGGVGLAALSLSPVLESTSHISLGEASFQTMLAATRVESYPLDYTQWSFDILLTLIQGPLRSLGRFRLATGCLRILLAFYTPQDRPSLFAPRSFTLLPPEAVHPSMCAVGVALVDLLLLSREGAQLLDASGLPRAMAQLLREVQAGTSRLLREELARTAIGQTTWRMMGRFSAYANGLLLMRDYGMLTLMDGLLSRSAEDQRAEGDGEAGRHDVCYQLLQHLFLGQVPHFGVCEELRQTFRRALQNPSQSIRLIAVIQLRKVVWRDLSTSMRWGIETLVQTLHDDYFSVTECAFHLLLSICLLSDEGLDCLIALYPAVLMESEVIRSHAERLHLPLLLYRIASRPAGLRFLLHYGWIEQELQRWEATASVAYVELLDRLQMGGAVPTGGSSTAEPAGKESRRAHDSPSLENHSTVYSRGGASVSLPSLSTTNAWRGSYFPVHFAAVLCASPEGCALFKHSELWTRSVRRLTEQPLPPDIAYDDSLSDQSGTSEDDESFQPTTGWETRGARRAGAARLGSDGTTQTHFTSPSALPTSPLAGEVGGRGSISAPPPTVSMWDLSSRSTQSMRDSLGTSQGLLGCTTPLFISAALGYKSPGQTFSMDCVGDTFSLKDAILCLCEAGSSDVGYAMVQAVPGLLRRLIALFRFSSSISVRSASLVGTAILSRSQRAAADLAEVGFSVLSDASAYVSAEGVPYAVSFAHLRPSKSMSIERRNRNPNTAPRYINAVDGKSPVYDVPKRLLTNVLALCNPVSREGAKRTLYEVMKRRPQVFADAQVRRLCLEAGSRCRMGQAERKYLADLLENAQLLAVQRQSASTSVSSPPRKDVTLH